MRRLVNIFLFTTLLCASASAQNASTESIRIKSITASYVPTTVSDTPASVTIITANEMKRRGDSTLAQALAAVPGLNVVPSGGPGSATSVFIQGSNSEDVLVLLDGVPINDPSVSNGAFNFGVDGLADIARIVVVRGPMSGLYGSGAIGGVINLVSKRGTGAPHISYNMAGGFPGQGEASATVSGVKGAFDFALTGSIIEQAGFDSLARRLLAYRAIRNPFRYQLAAANLGYRPIAGTRVSLIVRARKAGSTYPDLGYPAFDDPYENSYDSQVFSRLGVKSRLFDQHLTSSLYLSHLEDDRRYLALLDPADPNQFAGNSSYTGTRTVIQFNNVLSLKSCGIIHHCAFVAGFEQDRTRANQNVNESFYGSPYKSTVNAGQRTTAFHIGGQGHLFPHMSLMAALRDDGVSGYGNVITGRIGAVVMIPALSTRLKFSYGSGFLAPSLFDLYGIDTYGYRGNPSLKPERSVGYQVGATTTLANLGCDCVATISADYFHDNINNLIEYTQVSPEIATEENIAVARIHGVETQLDLHPVMWLKAQLTYTYTQARDGLTGAALLRRPENAGSALFEIEPTPRIEIVPQIRYIGQFSDYLTNNSGYPSGIGLSNAGAIVNLTVNFRIFRSLTLFATGRNLLNSPFEPINGLQIPGQNFLFGVRGRTRL